MAFDIAAEGRDDAPALTWISLRPTEVPVAAGMAPIMLAFPIIILGLALVGVVVYRRRVERREALQTTPAMHEQRHAWSVLLVGAATPWLYRFLGIRRIELTAPLSPEECKQRLRDALEGEWALFRWGKPRSGFQGRVGQSRFRISRKESIFFASRYQTFLYGSLSTDGAATRLRCSLSPQRLLFVLVGVFLLFAWTAFPAVSFGQGWFQRIHTAVSLRSADGDRFHGPSVSP